MNGRPLLIVSKIVNFLNSDIRHFVLSVLFLPSEFKYFGDGEFGFMKYKCEFLLCFGDSQSTSWSSLDQTIRLHDNFIQSSCGIENF